MSTTLHAFRRYECKDEKIEYIEDEPIDLCASTWVHHIYPALRKASEVAGCNIDIPVYDEWDNAEEAMKGKLKMIDPEVFTIALEEARDKIEDTETLRYVDEVLLPRTRKGLYLVEDRE